MPTRSLDTLLRRLEAGSASSAELERATGQSQSAMSRRLRALIAERRVLRMGSTRGARYALLRNLPGIDGQWPLRQVGLDGAIHELGVLSALAADEYYFESSSDSFAWRGLTQGLPYFLQDQRPGGFLGRAVPSRYPELALPQRVIDWSDDHYLRYLTQRGADTVGDLILGDVAFNEHLAQQRQRGVIRADERAQRYPQFATQVMEGGLPGSSAHGEHPKFATLIEDAAGARHVLVKFSPPMGTAVGQRWADLLIAEHLAHVVLSQAGLPTSRSLIHQFGDRTYLESDRFDRVGVEGRRGVTSLLAIDTALYGQLDNWIAAAIRLQHDQRINETALQSVRQISTFGELIANTDRHFGNLAFYDRYDGRFELAPVYDMLPMLFSPEHDQIVERTFEPPAPNANTFQSYGRARSLAQEYWQRCTQDMRISAGFRAICGTCAAAIDALPRVGAYAE
jgi:hypothetical protein